MSNYRRYSHFITRSVDHIFKNFLNDHSIQEVFETQSTGKNKRISIEIDGTISGELIINIPVKTLDHITKKLVPNANTRELKQYYSDIAGEIANQISGTFANQLQFLKHDVRLAPPEIDDDATTLKTLYENINLSFRSIFGGFDVDLFYKENN